MDDILHSCSSSSIDRSFIARSRSGLVTLIIAEGGSENTFVQAFIHRLIQAANIELISLTIGNISTLTSMYHSYRQRAVRFITQCDLDAPDCQGVAKNPALRKALNHGVAAGIKVILIASSLEIASKKLTLGASSSSPSSASPPSPLPSTLHPLSYP